MGTRRIKKGVPILWLKRGKGQIGQGNKEASSLERNGKEYSASSNQINIVKGNEKTDLTGSTVWKSGRGQKGEEKK